MHGNDRRGAKHSRFLFIGSHVAPVAIRAPFFVLVQVVF